MDSSVGYLQLIRMRESYLMKIDRNRLRARMSRFGATLSIPGGKGLLARQQFGFREV
jgi:hypothetical protein